MTSITSENHDISNVVADIDMVPNNDNLNNEEYDATWGGIKSRYMYNFVLQPFVSSESSNDSDRTESFYSGQSKTTMEMVSESDLSSNKSCSCSCNCGNPNGRNPEYEVASSSSSSHVFDHSDCSSESSLLMDYKYTKKHVISNVSPHSSDTGYLPDETDVQMQNTKKKLPPPACFKTCLQCRKENPNPYFQYCYTCFKYRKEFFENKPKPKRVKRLKSSTYTKSGNSFKNFKIPDSTDFLQPGSVLKNNKRLLRKDIDKSKNITNATTKKNIKNTQNICNICFKMPQNAIFNHGKVGHIYGCYLCAKELWKKSKMCPVCNVKVQYITKMIVV